MTKDDHIYVPPHVTPKHEHIPDTVWNYLNGKDLLSKSQAIRLSTLHAEGWPHAALLSAGEILLLPDGRIRFVIFSNSETTANLKRDSRLTMSMTADGKMCELRMHVHEYREGIKELPLTFFEGQIDEIRLHAAPYADLVSGINFKLHHPEEVNKRWQRQIDELRLNS